jgi:hypothetical protein
MSPNANRRPRIISLRPVVNRMRFSAIVMSLVIAFAASTAQGAVVQATGGMTIDGSQWSVPIGFAPELGLYGVGTWDSATESFSGFEATTEAGDHVTISGVLQPDPAISYSIGVTDFGAPSTFGFFFSSPIVLGPGPTSVDASVTGGLTDFTGNGVTITPTAAFLQLADVGAPTTNMGVNVGGPVSGGPGAAGANYSYGPFGAGPLAGPAGPWSTLSVTVGFTLTGGSDSAALTGFAEIVSVPEPSSVCMLATGAMGLLYFARRRRA